MPSKSPEELKRTYEDLVQRLTKRGSPAKKTEEAAGIVARRIMAKRGLYPAPERKKKPKFRKEGNHLGMTINRNTNESASS